MSSYGRLTLLIDASPVHTPERAADPPKDLIAPVVVLKRAADPAKDLIAPVVVLTRTAEPPKDPIGPVSVVSDYIAPAPARHLPQMLLATTLVAVLPLALSLGLRASGLISGWVSVGLAVAMSLTTSTAGSTYWRKRGSHDDVLFGELLLWGWLRRWRQERELANATRLLNLAAHETPEGGAQDELSVELREHLLRQLAGALEGQDLYLNGHSRRVARHATMIARGMGLPSEEVARVRAAAAVHDVGKLRTPKAVLNKPGRLTDEEFEVIKRHPVDGAEMVAALGDPELTRIVRHHHERLDGAGYPDRLSGDAIPVGARIIAVADTFDAITSARPYRDAAPHQKAIDILRTEAGTQLDPDAVHAFLAYYSGSRPTVIWAVITSSIRRVVAWLSGDPAAAATISAGKVAAATVATATIGAVAVAAPVPVVHHAHRAVAAHSVTVRPRGAAGHARVGVALPAIVPSGTSRTTNVASAKRKRGAAHGAAARRHAKPTAAKTPHRATAGAGTAASSPTRAVSQGASHATVTAPTVQSSQPAPASHSQGSNANGNANGHTKPLGNGHGQGVANGHGNAAPAPSAAPRPPANGVTHANPNANVPATAPSSAGGQSNANGTAAPAPAGQGNANGTGAAPASTSPASTPPAGAPPAANVDSVGTVDAHPVNGSGGGGNGHGAIVTGG